jgi:hypothetical protein
LGFLGEQIASSPAGRDVGLTGVLQPRQDLFTQPIKGRQTVTEPPTALAMPVEAKRYRCEQTGTPAHASCHLHGLASNATRGSAAKRLASLRDRERDGLDPLLEPHRAKTAVATDRQSPPKTEPTESQLQSGLS